MNRVLPWRAIAWGIAAAVSLLASPRESRGAMVVASPSATEGQPGFYRAMISRLVPGDTLLLSAGTYPERLDLTNVRGEPGAWITIMGPESGPPAIVTTSSTCCNTVQLDNTWYVAIRNLTVDSAGLEAIDGINAHGHLTHDILIQGCRLVGQGHSQGTIGISTKSPAWNWTIRGNRIVEAGTGLYLGNSDGKQPFIAGTIEGNWIENSIGYNLEIKHQVPYAGSPWVTQVPPGPNRTVIRDNVFIKSKTDWPEGAAEGERPSLLTGTFPASGIGKDDLYEIYGNFLYMNPTESLIQASGRVSIHDNVLVASALGGYAIVLRDHDGPLMLADVYNNTVYSRRGRGIWFGSGARIGDRVTGNLIFADVEPLGGTVKNRSGNIVSGTSSAGKYVNAPSTVLGKMDFYPKAPGSICRGKRLDLGPFRKQLDFDRDFNGAPKGDGAYRGAYAGAGANPGWALGASMKPDRSLGVQP